MRDWRRDVLPFAADVPLPVVDIPVGLGVGPVLSVAEVVDLATIALPGTWCTERAESGVSS